MDVPDRQPEIARRAHRLDAEVAAFLRAQLLPGEAVVAHQRGGVMVTDRRVLLPWPGYPSGRPACPRGSLEVGSDERKL